MNKYQAISTKMKIGDICPECGDSVPFGQAAVVNEEGCSCYACGFSEC